MLQNKGILKKLEQLLSDEDRTPQEIYKLLSGKEPVVYSEPLCAIFWSKFL